MTLHEELELAWFLWPSLVTAAAVSLAAAPAGAIVMLRRDSLLALALPQVVALGLAFGLRFHLPPWLPALAVVTLALLIVAWARPRQRADSLLPALYIIGMAGSILLISHSGERTTDIGVWIGDWRRAGNGILRLGRGRSESGGGKGFFQFRYRLLHIWFLAAASQGDEQHHQNRQQSQHPIWPGPHRPSTEFG